MIPAREPVDRAAVGSVLNYLLRQNGQSSMFTYGPHEHNGHEHNGHEHNGHEPSLEKQLKYLNSKLLGLNDQISRLEFQRGRVQLTMQHVAREIRRQQAAETKRVIDSRERNV